MKIDNAIVVTCTEFAFSLRWPHASTLGATALLRGCGAPGRSDGLSFSIKIEGLGSAFWSANAESQDQIRCRDAMLNNVDLLFISGNVGSAQPHAISDLLAALRQNAGGRSVRQLPDGAYIACLVEPHALRVSLVRDSHGIAPIYYVENAGARLLLQSWSKSLEHSTRILNAEHVLDALVEDFSSYETMARDVDVLRPGWRWFYDGSLAAPLISTPLSPRLDMAAYEVSSSSGSRWDKFLDELHRKLVESIDKLTLGHSEVNMLLSGGLDSTIIAVIAHRELGKRVVAHTFRPLGPYVSGEQNYMLCMGNARCSRHYWVDVSDERLFELTADACRATGAIVPFLHGGARLELMKHIGAESALCLGGEGSDEYFFGYPYMYRSFVDTQSFAGEHAATMPWSPGADLTHENPRHHFVDTLYKRVRQLSLMAAGCGSSSDHESTDRGSTSGFFGRSAVLGKQIEWDQAHILGNYSLRYLGNELDHYGHVVTRLPFLDNEVTQRASQVDPAIHLHDGRGKFVLRELARKFKLLDEPCLARNKEGFIAAPVGTAWVEGFPVVQECLQPSAIEEVGIFRVDAVRQLMQEAQTHDRLHDRMLLVSVWAAQVVGMDMLKGRPVKPSGFA